MLAKYSKSYDVMARDVDFDRKMKLSTIFTYFEDIAGLHADKLGIGIDKIGKEQNLGWVLTRIKVEIIRYPRWNESIIVETWPHKPQSVKFNRDYYIKDTDGNILIKASSIWAVIDMKERTLQRADRIAFDQPEWNEEKAITARNEKLIPICEPVLIYKKVIGCSDIDMNEHLNNSKYIDYIIDCFTLSDLKAYKADSIDVSYVNEALPGDTILLKKDSRETRTKQNGIDVAPEQDKCVYIEGIREIDQAIIFKAKLSVSSK